MKLSLSKQILMCITIILMICTVEINAADLTLSRNGKSDYSIVLSTEASMSEEHGARELQMFLGQIGNSFIPIKRENETIDGPMILLGKSGLLQSIDNSIDFTGLGKEGFVIKTRDSHLIIAGGRLRGTMYGVYNFLEDI